MNQALYGTHGHQQIIIDSLYDVEAAVLYARRNIATIDMRGPK
jgi:hypothetical protein